MTLWRVIRAERLKLKGTFAPKMALFAPMTIVLLVLLLCSQAPYSTLRRMGAANDWTALARVNFLLWGLLMLPLYITLQSALVSGLDHAENQWKAVLARPIPRWTVYIAKLIVVSALLLFSTLELLAGIFVSGLVMSRLQSEVTFAAPVPMTLILREGLLMSGLGFLSLSIQHWISLRWRSFAVSVGTGILAMVTGYVMYAASQPNGFWTQYFPWALPMLVMARWPVEEMQVLALSVVLGCGVSAMGCAEFSRRDIQ